jgi:hypothetical protein
MPPASEPFKMPINITIGSRYAGDGPGARRSQDLLAPIWDPEMRPRNGGAKVYFADGIRVGPREGSRKPCEAWY